MVSIILLLLLHLIRTSALRERNDRHELFCHIWKGHDNHLGTANTPLFAFLQSDMASGFDASRASKFHWDFKVDFQTVMEYIGQVLAWRRVCMLEDVGDGFSGVEYWTEHILIFDVVEEDWGGEATLGFKGFGQRMADLLTVKLDSDPDADEYKDAYKVTWRLLTQSSMQKITHGKGLTNDLALGIVWDQEEYEGKDCLPGTFGELLRYGAVNFEQIRERIRVVDAPRPEETLKKGLLEA